MGKRRNRPRGAIRPNSYTGAGGQTFTADQVAAMLAAAQRGSSTPVAKAFGNAVPPAIVASEAQQQMTPASAFSPGEPISPYDGYSRQPRTRDFPAGYNIATRPRLHERVSFDTLKGLIDSYDVAQACIWHRIDTLRSVKLRLVPAEGYSGDVSGAIDIANGVLRKPDGRHYFKNWLAKWLYDVLAYDAGALYRLRNRGGRCVGLAPVSGPTIAPLLDWWGNEPLAPAPAYVQYGQGLVFNWLTRDDLIYEPMRPVNDSIYGRAPIEAVIMNANTDIRTQIHFLQRYTEGNIPEAFASAPETWSPDQIEQWQNLWDSIMYGDQSRKSQIRWMPGGSTIVWSSEKDFTDAFSLFMMRKTCASFHVVPVDLGFTESSNYSTGESQADVAHKVGELPLMEYTEEILSQFLYDDLRLPLKAEWDRGEDQDDRATQAASDQTYINSAVVSADEIREMRFGLPIDSTQPVPRIFFSERGGPIPLNAVLGVAGPNDPETASPSPGAPLPKMVFPGTPAVMDATVLQPPLAESEYGLSALPPAPPMQPMPPGQAPVGKEATAGDGGGSPGITAETGLYGDPLIRDDDEDDDDRKQVAKSELAAFRRYTRSRRKAGEWRDFRFTAVGKVAAHNLNDSGRLAVRKDAGQIAVAGLAVLAADTGRVLMLQRALEDDDPAAGKLEFPGGHLEGSESPLAAAWREWCEETGCIPPPGVQTGSWVASNGIYQGIVWTVDSELMVPVRGSNVVPNPDMDPDGDGCEAILFMDPADLPGNPAVRPELLADIDAVMSALGCDPVDDSEAAAPGSDCCGAECCADGCCNGTSGCTCGITDAIADDATDVAKAASPPPKWPGWELDLPAADYWGKQITAALSTALTEAQAIQLANAYLAAHPQPPQQGQKREAVAAAALWLSSQGVNLAPALTPLMPGILADGYLIGAVSATTMTDGTKPGTGGWKPGSTQAAQDRADALGLGSGLAGVLDVAPGAANSVSDGYMTALGRALVDAAAAGLTAKAAGTALLGVLSDAAHAAATALGEIVTAIGQAAVQWYRKRHVEWVAWFTDPTSNVCPVCIGNEAQGPVPFGTPFESGDTNTPAHPRCRCCTAPVPAPEDA